MFRIHLSELNAPYTQYGWQDKQVDDAISGKWSLKVHKQPKGVLLATSPQSINFDAHHSYRIEFDYQTDGNKQYQAVALNGEKVAKNLSKPLESTNKTGKTKHISVVLKGAENGKTGLGILNRTDEETDFVLDNLKVTKLD